MTSKAARKPKSADRENTAAIVYCINTLLHTMRAIERHEEQLCILMTEVRNSGVVTSELDEELRDILQAMPAHEYRDDIDAVRQALSFTIANATPSRSPAPRRRTKPSAPAPSKTAKKKTTSPATRKRAAR